MKTISPSDLGSRGVRFSFVSLFFIGFFWISGGTGLAHGGEPLHQPRYMITVLNAPDPQRPIPGKKIILHLRVKPSPSPSSPEHFHVYVDRHMEVMFTMRGPEAEVTLNHLSPGMHRVWIIQADPQTHLLLHEGEGMAQGSSGMGMGSMSDGSMGGTMKMQMGDTTLSTLPKSIRVTKFVLLVQ
ncbi:MAG: hypothetical protein ACYCTV_00050 [Leptospirales bacterium]